MAGQGQQTIVVVQQSRYGQDTPGLRRGTHVPIFNRHMRGNGIKLLIMLGVFGIMLSFFFMAPGAIISPFFFIIFFPLIPASVVCLVLGCSAAKRAQQEYDALPLDHPDRIKYSGVAAVQQQFISPGIYPQPSPGGYNPTPGGYIQPAPVGFNPQPGGYNQPFPGGYNQPPSGAYNLPPFDPNQPPPEPYCQPPAGSGSGNYSCKSGQPVPHGEPGAPPTTYDFQHTGGITSGPPPPDAAADFPPSYDQIKT